MLSVIIPTFNSERLLVPTLAMMVPGAMSGLVREVTIWRTTARRTATLEENHRADVAAWYGAGLIGEPLGRAACARQRRRRGSAWY